MAITEVNRKKDKGKKAIKKILKKGNTCKNRQKGGKKGMSHMIKCFILGEDGKIQDDGVSFTQGTLPDMKAIAESVKAQTAQIENKIKNNQKSIIKGLETEIGKLKEKIKNLPAGTTPAGQAAPPPPPPGTTLAQAQREGNADQADTAGKTPSGPNTVLAQGQAGPDTELAPGTSGTSQQPTDELNNAKSNVQQKQQKTIEIFNNKKMKSIILLKQAYILKLLVLKNNVKKGTFNIKYNANVNPKSIELTYLDMLSINGDVKNFKKYIGDANATIEITNITLTIGTNIQKEFRTLQEIIDFLNALENFNLDGLFTPEEINFLNNSKEPNKSGGKKRKYRRAIKKALKQKSVKGCVKININEKNKKRKKTFNRKIKIRNGSLRKK